MHLDFSLALSLLFIHTGEIKCSVSVVDSWNRLLLRKFL